MAYLSDDELLDTEGGFTVWDDKIGAGSVEETLEQALSEERLAELEGELEQSPYPYVVKIQGKVKELIAQHRSGAFDTWLDQDKISCLPNYVLPAVISPNGIYLDCAEIALYR